MEKRKKKRTHASSKIKSYSMDSADQNEKKNKHYLGQSHQILKANTRLIETHLFLMEENIRKRKKKQTNKTKHKSAGETFPLFLPFLWSV